MGNHDRMGVRTFWFGFGIHSYALGHVILVKLLFAVDGIDFENRDEMRNTPLMNTVKNGREAVVRILLVNGVTTKGDGYK